MSFTYGGNPGNSPLEAVRFILGDTDEANAWFEDGELLYLIDQCGGSTYSAALRALSAGILKYSRLCDETVGAVSIRYSQLLDNLIKARNDLTQQLAFDGGIEPYAGGISQGDKRSVAGNSDRTPPLFRRGMMETPGLNSGDSGSADDNALDGSGIIEE